MAYFEKWNGLIRPVPTDALYDAYQAMRTTPSVFAPPAFKRAARHGLPPPIQRGLRGERGRHSKRGVHKLRNAPSPVRDATGFFICSVSHREDLHARSFQYADNHLKREEARRIAKAISRLPTC